jgi:hypothetical protein
VVGEDKSALEAVVAADEELVSLREEEKRLQVRRKCGTSLCSFFGEAVVLHMQLISTRLGPRPY